MQALNVLNPKKFVDARLKSKKSGYFVLLSAFFSFFAVVYYPVILSTYGFADDYPILFGAMDRNLKPIVELTVAGGRPLYGVLLTTAFKSIRDIEGLRWIRLYGIIGVAALAVFSYFFTGRAGLTKSVRLTMSLLLGLMPAFQLYTAWAVTAFYPWAALLSGMAFWSIDSSGTIFSRRTLVAVILLTASITIYQPAAMMFWVFAGISWVLSGRQTLEVKKVTRAAVVMFVVLAIDFGMAKILAPLLFHDRSVIGRTTLVANVPQKISWFVSEVLKNALNFPVIEPSGLTGILMAMFIASGLWMSFGEGAKNRGIKAVLALSLVPLCYLPNLIVGENWASYRTQVALTSLLVAYVVVALSAWGKVLGGGRFVPALMAATVAVCAVIAHWNTAIGVVAPQSKELRRIANYFAGDKDLANASSVYLVTARWQDKLSPIMRYDEFGNPSSSKDAMVKSMAWLILHKSNATEAKRMDAAEVGPIEKAPAGATIIDFGQALRR